MTQHTTATYPARITAADVEYRVGDGPLAPFPQGQRVTVAPAIASMVLSWECEGQPITATLAKPEFELYVARGKIVLE